MTMILPNAFEVLLFDAVRQLEDPAEQQAFLAWSLRDEPEVLARLRIMLETEEDSLQWYQQASAERARVAADLLDESTPYLQGSVACAPADLGLPAGIAGRFHVCGRIGGGGGGEVFLADQIGPIRRKVAIKVLRAGLDTADFQAAFRRESQSLALMNHPNIAAIHDAGTTASGRPYFIMEMVEGRRITEFCDEGRLSIRQRLDLFLQVCAAIQHAHQKGIIHRDIKPANILVSTDNGQPMVKVIDFGIAAEVDEDQGGRSPLSIGTPAYMSPEQASGTLDIDTRSDIYSLGIVLRELLAGPCHDAPATTEPSRIVAALTGHERSAVAAARNISPARLLATLRGDLDAIITKATSPDRQSRYSTSAGLAMDIQHHLQYEPVMARFPHSGYLLAKLVRRHSLACGIALVAILAVATAASLAIRSYLLEKQARQDAESSGAKVASLLRQSESRERIAMAAIYLGQNQVEKADAILLSTPLEGITPSLEAANVLRALGDHNATLGRWNEASECFVKLMEANRLEPAQKTAGSLDFLCAAPALLENGDIAKYDSMRREMLERLPTTNHATNAEHMVKLCLLTPTDPAMLAKLQPMADLTTKAFEHPQLVTGAYYPHWIALARAIYDYRAGNHSAAITWADRAVKCQDASSSCIATSDIIMAMANHRLGHPEEAARLLAAARHLLEEGSPKVLVRNFNDYYPSGAGGYWYSWAIVRVLLREAEAMTH